MPAQYGKPSRHVRSVTEKAAYSRKARKKIVDSKAKLDNVKAAIKRAVTTGRLTSSSKLENAQQAMDMRLAAAESRLEALQKSGDEDWEELRDELENAWEDLSHSISALVARLKDVSDYE